MSKIICDVCGTSYPETATQCPICGCVRPSNVNVVTGDTEEKAAAQSGSYTYVKGGRFSKSNVKRRNRLQQSNDTPVAGSGKPQRNEKGGRDTGLVVAICILLMAIVAVVVYIALHFFNPGQDQPIGGNTTDTSTTESTVLEIPCTDLVISKTSVELGSLNAVYLLNVTPSPADTTDIPVFASSDEAIATVNADGKIIAVAPGEATITITCGTASVECKVVCNFEIAENTENEEAATDTQEQEQEQEQQPVVEGYVIKPSGDVTLWLNAEEHLKFFKISLRDGSGKSAEATWSVADTSICQISDGVVTALKVGKTTVSTTFEGETYECIVRVREK